MIDQNGDAPRLLVAVTSGHVARLSPAFEVPRAGSHDPTVCRSKRRFVEGDPDWNSVRGRAGGTAKPVWAGRSGIPDPVRSVTGDQEVAGTIIRRVERTAPHARVLELQRSHVPPTAHHLHEPVGTRVGEARAGGGDVPEINAVTGAEILDGGSCVAGSTGR